MKALLHCLVITDRRTTRPPVPPVPVPTVTVKVLTLRRDASANRRERTGVGARRHGRGSHDGERALVATSRCARRDSESAGSPETEKLTIPG